MAQATRAASSGIPNLGRRALFCLTLASGLLAACSTTPPVANGMGSNPDGTVTSFHRKSSGSLGEFDGPVVWNLKTMQWNGKTVVAVSAPQAGTTLHEPQTHAVLAVLGGDGKPAQTFEPPVVLPWPLEVGKTATTQHKVTVHASNRTVDLINTFAAGPATALDETAQTLTFKLSTPVQTTPNLALSLLTSGNKGWLKPTLKLQIGDFLNWPVTIYSALNIISAKRLSALWSTG